MVFFSDEAFLYFQSKPGKSGGNSKLVSFEKNRKTCHLGLHTPFSIFVLSDCGPGLKFEALREPARACNLEAFACLYGFFSVWQLAPHGRKASLGLIAQGLRVTPRLTRPVSASFLPRYSGVWKSQSTQGGCPAGQNRCEKIAMCWVAMFPRLSVALSTRRAASLALEQPEQPGLSSPTSGTEL